MLLTGQVNGNMKQVSIPKIFKPYKCDDLVRLGKIFDGGYLVNREDVIRTKTLLSFGIGSDFSFEEQFANLSGCSVIAYDDTENVKDNINYKNFFGYKHTHVNKKVSDVNSDDSVSLRDILSNVGERTFLKCDIEGAEYKLLDDLIEYSDLFTGMVFEFHNLNMSGNLNEVSAFIGKVKQQLVHVHINNYMYYKVGEGPEQQNIPDVFELVFSSSDNVVWDRNIRLPHLFDMPNNPLDTDFQIHF